MRRRVYIILAAMLLVFFIASCDTGNDAGVHVDEPPAEETLTPPVSPATPPPPSPLPSPAPSPSPPQPPPYGSGIPGVTPQELSELWERTDGSTATIPLTTALNSSLVGGISQPPVHNTTSDAYFHLINRHSDLIFVTHPSEDELNTASAQGVEMEVIPIVKDALVFLVNIENPVENLSLRQLRDIYSGTLTNWRSIGGLDERIIPYQRTVNSGSQTLLHRLVMNESPPMTPPSEWIAGSMGELIEIVSVYDNAREAIGYSMFYFVNNMFGNDQFKLLSINGVRPSRDTIMRGEYQLEDNYYAVIRKDMPEDHPARLLINWILTDEGQALAARAGYIPLRPLADVWPDESLDPIYLGEVNNSSGTGGTVLKATVDDVQPQGGVRPPMSDLFLDGFNFIQHINSEILAQLSHVYDSDMSYDTWGDRYQMRPFIGIPNDYPNYEIHQLGRMHILFLDGNPFFGGPMFFSIPLTEDISPYGVGIPEISKTYDLSGRIMPQVDLFTVSLNLRGKPEISNRVNAALDAWYDVFIDIDDEAGVAALNDFIDWYSEVFLDLWPSENWAYRLQPSVEVWRDFLSVSYILQLFDGPAFEMPMFRTISFDTRSGLVVSPSGMIAQGLDYSAAQGFTRTDFSLRDDWGWPVRENMPEGYVPVSGSEVTDAWILYGSLNVLVTEPDGRVLQFIFWN